MERRQFLKGSAMAGAALAFSSRPSWATGADAQVLIFPSETMGEISPLLYGQFTEHIGGVIYDGVWVGEHSKIRNYRGIRAELVDKMNQIHVPLIRWPGGCFADSYDWRDGIGPRASRPTRTNFWEVDPDARRLHEQGPQIFETNAFGTDEFMDFCKLTSSQPYLAANIRSLPALQFDQWVEYCNSPRNSTMLAQKRGADGSPEPYNARYWGVGNESWGCGGFFEPADYAAAFRRYTAWVPEYGLDLQFIGSGPNDNDLDWTHRFFEEMFTRPHAYPGGHFTGWSVHHYADTRRADALQFDAGGWYDVLSQCGLIEKILSDQWAAMGQYDTAHHVRLVVDEYGPWYREGTEVDPTHIFGQQITIRDALATALTLDTFNRNAEKVSMATNAQLINNINALFLCHEDRFIVTPNYYVFGMYAAHQGAQALRTEFAAPQLAYTHEGQQQSLWGLNGSASRKGSTVTVTLVNPDLAAPKQTQIALEGLTPVRVSGVVLAAADMHAHNTFAQPDHVRPGALTPQISSGTVMVILPPASVAKVTIETS